MPDLVLAAKDLTGPDVEAFLAGVRVGIGGAFLVVAIFGGLSIIRRILAA